MTKLRIGTMPEAKPLPNPLEVHLAESKWQFCNCFSCQSKRQLLDSLPGPPFPYTTFRHKDEKY